MSEETFITSEETIPPQVIEKIVKSSLIMQGNHLFYEHAFSLLNKDMIKIAVPLMPYVEETSSQTYLGTYASLFTCHVRTIPNLNNPKPSLDERKSSGLELTIYSVDYPHDSVITANENIRHPMNDIIKDYGFKLHLLNGKLIR